MCPSGCYPRLSAAPADIRPAFDVIDADRDGKISCADLKSFYSSSSLDAGNDDVIESMISVADSDRNGFVEFDEFELVLGGGGGSCNGGIMEEVFRMMDRDGDGRVGFADLKAYLEWAGIRLSDEDVKGMIRIRGGDESEGIGFEGLVNILAIGF